MPKPLRLRIQENLSDVIGTVVNHPDSPYSYVLAGNVFRGRVLFGDNDPDAMACILEVPLPEEQFAGPGESTQTRGQWQLLIQGFVEDDRENPTDPAHWMMADVKVALAKEREKRRNLSDPTQGILGLGQHVLDLRIGAGVCRPPDELSAKAYFWLAVTLDLSEDLVNPYED